MRKRGRTVTDCECWECEGATMGCMAEIYPLQVLLAPLAGWLNRQQGDVLAYANSLLRAQGEAEPVRPSFGPCGPGSMLNPFGPVSGPCG